MKVTVFNGSPRGRNSNTHRIVEPLLEGAREAGAETEEVFLVERDIKHCRGCFGCWGKTPGKCVINDEMPGLMDLFLESDCAGLGTPEQPTFQRSASSMTHCGRPARRWLPVDESLRRLPGGFTRS